MVAKSSADDDDIIVLDDSDDEQTAAPSASSQSTMGRTHSLAASNAPHSAAHMNMRLRPSPCSPTQSEGGSSASDPSVICIDLADSSSSPPSHPGTGEANRASSASTALPYMQRTSSYSPSTPRLRVDDAARAFGADDDGERRCSSARGEHVQRQRSTAFTSEMAMDNGDDGASSSLQLPTVSMQHMAAYPHAVSSSTSGLDLICDDGDVLAAAGDVPATELPAAHERVQRQRLDELPGVGGLPFCSGQRQLRAPQQFRCGDVVGVDVDVSERHVVVPYVVEHVQHVGVA